MAVVEVKRVGDIALVTLDHPPVNALSQAVRSGLSDAAKSLGADSGVKAIVITGAGQSFSAAPTSANSASRRRRQPCA